MALTAADILCAEVLTIPVDEPVGEAVRRLLEAHVSGAPVVGEGGEVLGVVSLTDVAEAMDGRAPTARATAGEEDRSAGEYYRGPALAAPLFRHEPAPPLFARPVADIMTPYVIDVAPDTPIAQVCRRMCDMHLHRVLVTENGRLCGVISALDVLEAVATGRLRPVEDGT